MTRPAVSRAKPNTLTEDVVGNRFPLNPSVNRPNLTLEDVVGVEAGLAAERFCARKENLFIPYGAPAMYGGQTFTQAMCAASLFVQKHAKKAPSNMQISSVHGIFISGGLLKNGDVFYDVVPFKVGRQFIIVTVTASQFVSNTRSSNGASSSSNAAASVPEVLKTRRKIFAATVSFHAPTADGMAMLTPMPPEARSLSSNDVDQLPSLVDRLQEVIKKNPSMPASMQSHIKHVMSDMTPKFAEYRYVQKQDIPRDVYRRLYFMRIPPTATSNKGGAPFPGFRQMITAYLSDAGPVTLLFAPIFGEIDVWFEKIHFKFQ